MRIAFVGLSGVPYLGRACDIRLANTANLLSEKADVIIVNRYSSTYKKYVKGFSLNENVITYDVFKSRDSGVLLSKFFFSLSIIKEFLFIIKQSKQNRIDYLHVYTGHYLDLVFYYIVSKISGCKIIYDYVEYRSEKKAPNIYHRLNNYLFDNHGAKLWDSCTVISDYLENAARKVNPNLSIFKQTPICDFNLFENNQEEVDIKDDYLMFCGGATANYYPVIKYLIESFQNSKIHKTKKLLLVLRGSDFWINSIKSDYPGCLIKTNLPYNKLIAYYKHAFGLLIPLRNSLSEIARFPNKICEYTASRGVIISTNYGEISSYFRDGYNAILAKDDSMAELVKVLDDLEEGRYCIEELKENAYNTGLKYFSFDSYNPSLFNFLNDNL